MAKKGTEYEKLTQKLYQQLLDNDNTICNTIEVKHNILILGKSGLEHQIDVFWEYELAGVSYKTIIEVKDWKTKVKKGDLMEFNDKLNDIPCNPNGIYVSKSGFQSGAIAYAEHHGIKIVSISETNLMKKLILNMGVRTPHIENFNIILDKEWLSAEKERLGITDEIKFSFEGLSMLENDLNEFKTVIDFIKISQKDYSGIEDGDKVNVTYKFDDKWYMLTDNDFIPKVLVNGFEYDFYYTTSYINHEIKSKGIADYIMYDIIKGTQVEFDEDNGDITVL